MLAWKLSKSLQNQAVPPQSAETLKPQKCTLKSEKCHFGPLGKMAPKSIKMTKRPILDILIPQNGLFGHYLIDFWGHFPEGSNMAFSDFKCTFGVSGFRGSVGDRAIASSDAKVKGVVFSTLIDEVRSPASPLQGLAPPTTQPLPCSQSHHHAPSSLTPNTLMEASRRK